MVVRLPFVSRSFDLGMGGQRRLTVRIFAPIRVPRRGYECEYEILTGRRRVRRFSMHGEDGLQALLLTLAVIVTEIEVAARDCGGQLSPDDMRDIAQLRPRITQRP